MRLVCLGLSIGVLVIASTASAAQTVRIPLPRAGDITVAVVTWRLSGAQKHPRLVLGNSGALTDDIVITRSARRAGRLWHGLVVIARPRGAPAATVGYVDLGLPRAGVMSAAAVARADVLTAARPAPFCSRVPRLDLLTARAIWWRAGRKAVPAPQLAALGVRAACGAGPIPDASLAFLDDAPAGTPSFTTPGQPASSTPPPAPMPTPTPPPVPAPVPPPLTLGATYRHRAANDSAICLAVSTAAGARLDVVITGPNVFTSTTVVLSAAQSDTLPIEIFDVGGYAIDVVATENGLKTEAKTTLVVTAAQGSGTCGGA